MLVCYRKKLRHALVLCVEFSIKMLAVLFMHGTISSHEQFFVAENFRMQLSHCSGQRNRFSVLIQKTYAFLLKTCFIRGIVRSNLFKTNDYFVMKGVYSGFRCVYILLHKKRLISASRSESHRWRGIPQRLILRRMPSRGLFELNHRQLLELAVITVFFSKR